ncbi:MAG: hypothetical protein H6806_09365 [Planctomycetes bacterium]|nr:hypothetical protein [Planctomycetota bacterium]
MLEGLEASFRRTCPAVEHASLRWHRESRNVAHVRNDVLEPWMRGDEAGVLVTVRDGGGAGYAATSDLSDAGLAEAFRRAWPAARTRGRSIQVRSRCPRPSRRLRSAPLSSPSRVSPLPRLIDRLR